MNIERIDHIVITVQDIGKSIDFYTKILGLKYELGLGNRHILYFGQQKINLHTSKGEFQPAAKYPEYGSQDLCFIVSDDLELVKIELEKNGIEIIEGIVDRKGALGVMRSLYIRDPDGNLIELAAYYK